MADGSATEPLETGLPPGGVDVALSEPAADEDWLDRVCPYLRSEAGTWRSTQPDASHRCTAQDPPGTLPTAFQERFCLSERHVRCEMYKYAQSARTAAFEQEGIPAEQVRTARFKPSVRSVPLALGPASESAVDGRSRALPGGPVVLAAVAVGAVVILILVLAFLLGGLGGPGTGADDSPSPPVAEPTLASTPGAATPTLSLPGTTPAATSDSAAGPILINYEVQEGEALVAIAETFGTTRQRIIRANEGMADRTPYVETGDVIIVPVSADMAEEDITALPGFEGFVE